MGLVYAEIEIVRGADLVLVEEGIITPEKIRKMVVKAMVDSGAYMLALNENIRLQLDLRKVGEQYAELADGSRVRLDIVGPVEVKFENRRANVDAMVLPGNSEVLLGAIPMEDMDVLIDPLRQKLIVNPENPYIVKKPLK